MTTSATAMTALLQLEARSGTGAPRTGTLRDRCKLSLRHPSVERRGEPVRRRTDFEFLTAMLQSTFGKNDARKCARCIFRRYVGLADAISNWNINKCDSYVRGKEISEIFGDIHPIISQVLSAAYESKPVISHYSDLITKLQWSIGMKDVEEMRALFLDSANHLLADETLSTGTVNHVPVYVREVIERSLAARATAIILAHNHPSGKVEPSDEDIQMTNQINESMSLVGITLHDHIIVGKGRWYSFKSAGMLVPHDNDGRKQFHSI